MKMQSRKIETKSKMFSEPLQRLATVMFTGFASFLGVFFVIAVATVPNGDVCWVYGVFYVI